MTLTEALPRTSTTERTLPWPMRWGRPAQPRAAEQREALGIAGNVCEFRVLQ